MNNLTLINMLNYIIATYAGNKLEYSLQVQLQVLYSLIMQGETKHIGQVTIVCPRVKDNDTEHPFYYQKELWSNLFKETKVKLVYLEYEGENNSASYDQWIQAYLAYPDFEYFLFIEDDYCIHPSLVNFDSILLEYYKSKCENGGYLCSLAVDLYGFQHHAAISNGIADKNTMEMLGPNILKDFYKMDEKIHCQIRFSNLFTDKKIDIITMHNDFIAWFWCSKNKILENYSDDDDVTQILFIPIQYLFYPYFAPKTVSIESTKRRIKPRFNTTITRKRVITTGKYPR